MCEVGVSRGKCRMEDIWASTDLKEHVCIYSCTSLPAELGVQFASDGLRLCRACLPGRTQFARALLNHMRIQSRGS